MVDESAGPDRDQSSNLGGCTFSASWDGRVAVLIAIGTVDALTAPQLTEAFDAVLGQEPAAVIIDLTGVDFLASAGMSALIDAREKTAGSTHFSVVASGPVTSRPMRLVGLHEIIPLFETLDEAREEIPDA